MKGGSIFDSANVIWDNSLKEVHFLFGIKNGDLREAETADTFEEIHSKMA